MNEYQPGDLRLSDGIPPTEVVPDLNDRGPEAAKLELGVAPAPYIPRPKPVITPERTVEGWRTSSIALRRAGGNTGYYLTIPPAPGKEQVIHLTDLQLDGLVGLAAAGHDAGDLWRRLSEIPLERPLPSRALEEELRVLLSTFGAELRQPTRRS